MGKRAFVYLITLRDTGQVYVGKSIDPDKRWKKHCWHASRGKDKPLYDAIRQFGPQAFDRQIIDEYSSEEEALLAEEQWKTSLKSQGIELFNGTKNKGRPWGMTSTQAKAMWENPETKAKICGQIFSDETRTKMSRSAIRRMEFVEDDLQRIRSLL